MASFETHSDYTGNSVKYFILRLFSVKDLESAENYDSVVFIERTGGQKNAGLK